MTYNFKLAIFRGTCDSIQQAINAWFELYAQENGGAPIITNILQTEASMNTLTISIFYNHATKEGQ